MGKVGRTKGELSKLITSLINKGDFVEVDVVDGFSIRQTAHYWNKKAGRSGAGELKYTVNKIGDKFRVTKNF